MYPKIPSCVREQIYFAHFQLNSNFAGRSMILDWRTPVRKRNILSIFRLQFFFTELFTPFRAFAILERLGLGEWKRTIFYNILTCLYTPRKLYPPVRIVVDPLDTPVNGIHRV